ncbi:YtxH domain-containing protein [Geothrix limicola]|uniref:YtxH domain-containing protein n=1 Tax=Geothrix limicola TaxID=2927978 RepID=UPI0025544476|nr:YtxH domain-containing protein [Geothrix limicola]
MTQSKSHAALSSVITFFAGAAIGAVVAALTTPKKGIRLRKDLAGLASEGKARIKAACNDLKGTGKRARRTFVWKHPNPKQDIHVPGGPSPVDPEIWATET